MGIVLIRAQYIHDQEALYKDIISGLQKKEDLIIQCLSILESQKMKYIESGSSENNNHFLQNSNEDSKILAAGFYSWNESEDLEEDLGRTDEERYYLQHSFDIQKNSMNPLLDGRMSSYINFSNEDSEPEQPMAHSMI